MTAVVTALWLGILTAMGPCTMTTNVLAIAFVARRWNRPTAVLWSSLWFTLGTVAGYACLGALLVAGAVSLPTASHVLQKYMNQLLGPVLILAGTVLLGLVQVRPKSDTPRIAERLAARGDASGAAALGVVFALTFCPISAALFFGSLLPIAIKTHSVVGLPALYGLGTGLPVLAGAAVMAAGAGQAARFIRNAERFEVWARTVTGVAFVIVGIHFCLAYIFELY